ncbi:MAG: response regulator [Candidatus Obscuribacterales bacterium]
MSDESGLLNDLSLLIRRKREEAGMSQTELANRSGLHRTYINNIEKGSKNMSIESLKKISDALGTTITELMAEVESSRDSSAQTIRILLIEDNPADVFMFKRCVAKTDFGSTIEVLESGKAAQAYLRKLTEDESAAIPDIIFLDLNLPGRSGLDLLSDIKEGARLRHVPVIILTTSSNPVDVKRTFSGYANSFLTKPIDPNEYERSIGEVLNYWFATSSIPD